MTIEAPGREVVAVQMLRAIAATMVMFVHVDHELIVLRLAPLGADWLSTGVDIFFVISGFIMWTSVERRGDMSAGSFFKNRIIRIVPLYWFVTTIVALLALAMPQLMTTTRLQLGHLIASYGFLPARHPTTGMFWPLVIPGWSLNYEMLFYVIFTMAIAFSGRLRLLRFGLIAGMLLALLAIANLTKSQFDVMNFYANPILLEFVAGTVLGIVWRSEILQRSWLWLPLSVVGFGLLWVGTHSEIGFAATFLGSTLIVAGAIFLPSLQQNPLSALGDASYSLYLTHAIILSAFGLFWKYYLVGLPWQLFVLAGCSIAIAVAFCTYRLFELPVTRMLKGRAGQARFSGTAMAGARIATRSTRES